MDSGSGTTLAAEPHIEGWDGTVPAEPDWMAPIRARECPGEQGGAEWARERSWRYTASDAAAILGFSAYGKEKDVWDKKLGRVNPKPQRKSICFNKHGAERVVQHDGPVTDGKRSFQQSMMAKGTFYEHQACALYAKTRGVDVYHANLIEHPEYKWLGGSPDGITSDGVIVEIKVPTTRVIVPGMVPPHIMPQLQVLMECLDMDLAHLVQYHPPEDEDDPGMLDITFVTRDRDWWKIQGARLKASYADFRVEYDKLTPERREAAWRGDVHQPSTAFLVPEERAAAAARNRKPAMRLASLRGWEGGTDAASAVQQFEPMSVDGAEP